MAEPTVKKNSLAARFAKDKVKEEQGVWTDFGDGLRVRIRRFKSKPVQDARAKFEKPYADVIRRGNLPVDVATEILVKQIAEAVISDWEGVTDEDGDEVLPTFDNIVQFLNALPDFRDEVLSISIDGENYKALLDADTEGNS